MAAIFGIAVSERAGAAAASQALAVAKVTGRQNVRAQRVTDDLARIAATNGSVVSDGTFVRDAQRTVTEFTADEAALAKGGQVSPPRAAEMSKIDGAMPQLVTALEGLARGNRAGDRARARRRQSAGSRRRYIE